VWVFRVEEDRQATAGADRPPVAYAEPAEDERAWRDTVGTLATDEDYRAAVFLRVASMRAADDTRARQLESPYRLAVERAYLLRVASLNPHLSADSLREARVVPLYDELATAVVLDETSSLPADGVTDILVSPIVPGPGWLELDVAVGLDVIAAASVGWVAEGAGATTAREPEPDDVEAPEDELDETGLPTALELPFAAIDPVAEAAVRAYAIAEEAAMPPPLRLRLLGELRAMAPDEMRLVEAEGLALYDAGDYDVARTTLAALPLDTLGPRGRATLVAATLRGGHVPDPIDRVRMADLWRAEGARVVLEASAALPPAEQVRLATFVAGQLLSEERASDWYAAVAERPLPAADFERLFAGWSLIDRDRAAAARGKMPPEGRS
jgi:hypothetical protein